LSISHEDAQDALYIIGQLRKKYTNIVLLRLKRTKKRLTLRIIQNKLDLLP